MSCGGSLSNWRAMLGSINWLIVSAPLWVNPTAAAPPHARDAAGSTRAPNARTLADARAAPSRDWQPTLQNPRPSAPCPSLPRELDRLWFQVLGLDAAGAAVPKNAARVLRERGAGRDVLAGDASDPFFAVCQARDDAGRDGLGGREPVEQAGDQDGWDAVDSPLPELPLEVLREHRDGHRRHPGDLGTAEDLALARDPEREQLRPDVGYGLDVRCRRDVLRDS